MALALGCGDKAPSSVTDSGADSGGASDAGASDDGGVADENDLTVTDFSVRECTGEVYEVAEMMLYPGGANAIAVDHLSVPASCCADFSATAEIDGETLRVTYERGDAACACDCSSDLIYILTGVPSGDWVVEAEGLRQGFNVP